MERINNEFYDELDERWLFSKSHAIALLQAENRLRNPWIASNIKLESKVLDIGCGGGLLTNHLARLGHTVSGVDISQGSIDVAKRTDTTNGVSYTKANAYELPFEDESFDVVCAMDILEHVEKPDRLIKEGARVLRPGGLFFFHTFNRNMISRLVIIKGVEWFVKEAPKNMHVYPLFIKPVELKLMCSQNSLSVQSIHGVRPCVNGAFFKMLITRQVEQEFAFRFSKSLVTGYSGIALKNIQPEKLL